MIQILNKRGEVLACFNDQFSALFFCQELKLSEDKEENIYFLKYLDTNNISRIEIKEDKTIRFLN